MMMRGKNFKRLACLALLLAALQAAANSQASGAAWPAPFVPTVYSVAAPPAAEGEIAVNVLAAANKAQRGRAMQAAVVMDIPRGLHVNSNRPLGQYAIPTTVRITAPKGVRVSAVSYPRSVVRKFEFSEERLAVYEGRAVMRFNVSFPASFPEGVARLRVVVKYQACSDTVCYPPDEKDMTIPIGVVGPEDPVQSINRNLFGGGRRR
jgi:DsbC/DsbD-like thiol-disulfide interchange protein